MVFLVNSKFDVLVNYVWNIRPLRGRRFIITSLTVGSIAFHPRLFEICPLRGRARAPKVLNNNNRGWSSLRNPRWAWIDVIAAPKGSRE
jgi:hypothetical protein